MTAQITVRGVDFSVEIDRHARLYVTHNDREVFGASRADLENKLTAIIDGERAAEKIHIDEQAQTATGDTIRIRGFHRRTGDLLISDRYGKKRSATMNEKRELYAMGVKVNALLSERERLSREVSRISQQLESFRISVPSYSCNSLRGGSSYVPACEALISTLATAKAASAAVDAS